MMYDMSGGMWIYCRSDRGKGNVDGIGEWWHYIWER